MPPFHSRSTGALTAARMSSSGVITLILRSMSSAAAISGVISIDLRERANTPPPGEMRSGL